ncbi:MAG: hypothetical protein AAGI01_18185, partial [Myxococcota bacterium]
TIESLIDDAQIDELDTIIASLEAIAYRIAEFVYSAMSLEPDGSMPMAAEPNAGAPEGEG